MDDMGEGDLKVIGKIYLLLWITISSIIWINLLIAMFSNTYNQLKN
jgi:hypothetical protein